ncbi:MAG TPA: sigma-54-dependent Fis family transcriptional regulator [Candidatus Polarisedimenticolaceae bacterium]|nr:sigma-54-dependent Fis family transcriptional regulator [Candidatus Polarisedimenticolaceae bacterium]
MGAPREDVARALLEALKGVLADVNDPSQVLAIVLDQSVRLSGADRGVLAEVGESGELAFRVLHKIDQTELAGQAGTFSRSVFGEVLKTGRPLLLKDALRTPGLKDAASVQAMRIISLLCLPISVDGKVVALVHLEHATPGHFTAAHEAMLAPLLDVAGPVIGALRAGRGVLKERDQAREAERRARKESEESRHLLAQEWSFGRFVGRTPVVRDLEATVRRAAKSDYPVLLIGESGTGKGVLARILHHAGPRSELSFVTVFCPSLERGLIESEMFGHRRGAFTGADHDRIGKVQAAEGGTLFLDEVGELPLEIQAKLLRLLQEKTYERVGDSAERSTDIRVIAATHRDLEADAASGRFRRDLFERLNFLPIAVPPLRERVSDIPLLLRHALDRHDAGRWIEIDDDAVRWLADLDFVWPGNVRHLEQLAARLAVEQPSGPVGRADLERLLGGRKDAASLAKKGDDLALGLPTLVSNSERDWLNAALKTYTGITRRELAEKLKISEAALYKKLKQHGLGG